ncbi:MAG: SOUL family heme-binding protein, partial [Bacteroidota bacterium]
MNRKKMLLLSIAVLSVIFLFWNLRLSAGTEQQPYRVLDKADGYEIRLYPPAMFASVTKSGQMMDIGSDGFRELAGYIFGGNSSGEKIAMTAPVVFSPAKENEASTEMRFVMPAGYTAEALPAPRSKQVQLWESDTVFMAVRRFGGFASNKDIEREADELRACLRKAGIAFEDKVVFMAYN